VESIYNIAPSSESDCDDDHKVFMVGQNNVPGDQTEKEIAQAAPAEIARSKKLAKDVEKAVRKKHMSPQDQNDDLVVSDEDGEGGGRGDGTTFGGEGDHPKFNLCH
jgi:hypothetical protein